MVPPRSQYCPGERLASSCGIVPLNWLFWSHLRGEAEAEEGRGGPGGGEHSLLWGERAGCSQAVELRELVAELQELAMEELQGLVARQARIAEEIQVLWKLPVTPN